MSDFQNKALIVGINSFLGVAIAEKLRQTHIVEGIHHENTDKIPVGIVSKSVDQLSTIGDHYQLVCFISAYIPVKGAIDHEQLFKTNVALLGRVSKQFPSARILHASSVSVYGAPHEVINEATHGKDLTAYGLSKRWAEMLLCEHPSYASIRISSMFGRGMKRSTFLPMIVKDAVVNQQILLQGDGSRRQNYIHVADVADCFVAAASVDYNGIFLAVSNQSYSNLEIARMIQQQLPETKIVFSGEDPSISSYFDGSHTRSVLKWQSEGQIQVGIQELIQWLTEQY